MLNRAFAELQRRFSSLIRMGIITEVDVVKARCRVRFGENTVTGWLPWQATRAGTIISIWSVPEVGEQVIVISPSGTIGAGFVLAGLYQNDKPAPSSSASKHIVKFSDGTYLEYDTETKELHFESMGDVVLKAAGNITLEAGGNVDVTATGNAKVTASRIDLN